MIEIRQPILRVRRALPAACLLWLPMLLLRGAATESVRLNGDRALSVKAGGLVPVGFITPATTEPQRAIYLAGAWDGSRGWVKPPVGRPGAQWSNSRWLLFRSPLAPPVMVRSAPTPDVSDDERYPTYSLAAAAPGGVCTPAAIKKPRPRMARRENPHLPELAEGTRRLLGSYGIQPTRVRVVEAWRVDLDGDGRDELVWTARSRDGWTAPYFDPRVHGHAVEGDYALLAMSYLAGGRPNLAALAVASARTDLR